MASQLGSSSSVCSLCSCYCCSCYHYCYPSPPYHTHLQFHFHHLHNSVSSSIPSFIRYSARPLSLFLLVLLVFLFLTKYSSFKTKLRWVFWPTFVEKDTWTFSKENILTTQNWVQFFSTHLLKSLNQLSWNQIVKPYSLIGQPRGPIHHIVGTSKKYIFM